MRRVLAISLITSTDPYTILGLSRGQKYSPDELKKVWRTQALKHHPDTVSSKEDKEIAHSNFIKITEAYESLERYQPVGRKQESYQSPPKARTDPPKQNNAKDGIERESKLYFIDKATNSDKLYNVALQSDGKGGYNVTAMWGGQSWSYLNFSYKAKGVTRAQAEFIYNKLVNNKLKKGYKYV